MVKTAGVLVDLFRPLVQRWDVDRLQPHEQVLPHHVDELTEQIRDARIRAPILADQDHGVILDGHHRYAAARRLGIDRVPVLSVPYFSPIVTVTGYNDRTVSKDTVITAGLTGAVLAPKSTQHRIGQTSTSRFCDRFSGQQG